MNAIYSEKLGATLIIKTLDATPAYLKATYDTVIEITVVSVSGVAICFLTLECNFNDMLNKHEETMDKIEEAILDYLTKSAMEDKQDAMYDGVYREH